MPQEFGSILGTNTHSGVRIDPRKEEDPDFNPPSLKKLREFKFQSPIPPPSQQQYEAPALTPGLAGAVPTPDFSPEAAQARYPAQSRMPQAPEARIQAPVYQEPEAPGWKRTALGIGLSGMANLSGQGAKAADDFFLEPERRAERDYAREMGAYTARQGEWSQYFDEMMAHDKFGLSGEQFEEQKRATAVEEDKPIQLSRGATLLSPDGREVRYQDPNQFFGGGSQWEFQVNEAYNYWLANNPGTTREKMTAANKDQAITQFRRRRGLETTVPGYDKDGNLINVPRSDAYYAEKPETYWDESGQLQYRSGRTDVRPRPPQVTEEDIARIDQWASDQKRLTRRNYTDNQYDFMAPLAGSPEEAAAVEALEAELRSIDDEAEQRKERLRSGTIEPGPGETRILKYNVETGRAE